MHDEQLLDGSDDTTGGSTQTQRRTALKDTMKAALLVLDGLDRASINDLANDQEYRDLIHRFISPLTIRPLQDAVDQANRALKHGLDEISRGMAGIFPLDDIPIVHPIRVAPSQVPIPASDLLPSQAHPAASTAASPESSVSPELNLSLRQRREPSNPPPLTPLEQIQQDRTKMVTIHFLVGKKKLGTTLKDIIDAANEVIWKRASKTEQRILEAWVTKKKDIVLACQSPPDVYDWWPTDLCYYLSYLWERGTVIRARRGTTTEYLARIVESTTSDKLTFSMGTLDLRFGHHIPEMETHFERIGWGAVDFRVKLDHGIYLCGGPVDILNTFVSAPPEAISFVGSYGDVYSTVVIGLRLSDDLDIGY